MASQCRQDHRYISDFESLPLDQGRDGRHKCAGCAYEKGFQQGLALVEHIELDLRSLPESQAGTVRHKSPHAAWAAGYLDGVRKHYDKG